MLAVSKPSTGKEEIQAIEGVFQSGWLGLGSKTFDFEEGIKKFIGCREAIAVNTGTSALHIALDGFGIGPGGDAPNEPGPPARLVVRVEGGRWH